MSFICYNVCTTLYVYILVYHICTCCVCQYCILYPILYIIYTLCTGDFSTFAEIDTAWLLRDNQYNFLWPSTEAVFSNNINDIYTTLLAMRAKASRTFYSPRQYFMERNKEGSKEYLGDILY